jgi:F-type H+/Na+-transporting ATPase subunit alpha
VQIKPDEITSILKQRIEGLEDGGADLSEVGTVLSIADGISRVHGLDNAMSTELLELPHDVTGLALNLESDNVGAVLFGEWDKIEEGDQVKRTGRLMEVPVGDELLGRIVSPLGVPLDGKGEIETAQTRPVEFKAPGVVQRQPVKEPLATGIKPIDAMTNVGRGQRELIIGDRQTGKTSICIDTIISQKETDVVCIYVAIGQRMSTVVEVAQQLDEYGALDHTIIVAAPADEAAPIKYLAPYAGAAMAEHFLYNGGHALAIYDDLTKHAYAYRQMSLLLRRPPGREAYPGDVFYLHSRLLERSVKLNDELGGGSFTALPIIETQAGDVSAYIPTNVISITDGQIFLEADLFRSGVRPAINVGISVSRVGGSAQTTPMRKVAGRLRLELSQYRELEAFAQFGSDLDADTQATLNRGARLVESLNQDERSPWPIENQVAAIYAGTGGYLDRIKVERVKEFLDNLLARLHAENDELMGKVKDGDWSDEIADQLGGEIAEAIDDFGPDFDAEGNPIEEGESDRILSEEREKEGRTSGSSDDGAGEASEGEAEEGDDSGEDEEKQEQKEQESAPA